jgi:uncharacterized phage protein (TIGR01671 family)
MRIPTFRAYDKRKCKMIFGPTDDNVSSSWVYTMATAGPYDDVLVLMESTGLHDKNGKEIFECDIVRYAFDWDYADKECKVRQFKNGKKSGVYIGWVAWEGDEHAHFVVNPHRFNLAPKMHLIEVVGNIYESPGLLAHTNPSHKNEP